MKKVLFVFAIATSLVSCNNAADTTATTAIDSAKTADSIKAAMPAVIDSAASKIDSAATKIDSAVKKMDSVIKK